MRAATQDTLGKASNSSDAGLGAGCGGWGDGRVGLRAGGIWKHSVSSRFARQELLCAHGAPGVWS